MDIGLLIGKHVDNTSKYEILTSTLILNDYNFKKDVDAGKRPFLVAWLKQYGWLYYSTALKWALYEYCVLFEPPLDKGSVQGTFIKKPFCKYKNFQEQSKLHIKSAWHNHSIQSAKDFISIMEGKKSDVYQIINSSVANQIESNK